MNPQKEHKNHLVTVF